MISPWFHGAPRRFSDWAQPPLVSGRDPFLVPHSFLALSRNLDYARMHAGRNGAICSATLDEGARVLDLRVKSEESFQLWRLVKATQLGRLHATIKTYHSWCLSCESGLILRYFFYGNDPQVDAASGWQVIANNPARSASLRSEAHWHLENFARSWIEVVISPARGMGYDAVICPELEQRIHSTSPSTQLFVFQSALLSKPDWSSAW